MPTTKNVFMKLYSEFSERVAAYSTQQGYILSKEPRTSNIVYVEGCNIDGKPNRDEANHWNDRRTVLQWDGSGWYFALNARATTEPGDFYTKNPLNKAGAFRIAFGQYFAWQFGFHHGIQPALVQVAPITGHRDIDKNGKRSPKDPVETGMFNINQHTTSKGKPPVLIGKHSAGCLVGHEYQLHLLFLELVGQDERYLDNKKDYVFGSIILPGDKLFNLK
jgi:hypothetical protein